MSAYTVIWWPPTQDDLALIWLDAELRPEVTDAANEIDKELSSNPDQKGHMKHEGLRELTIDPLVIQFSVDPGDQQVTIWSVKLRQD